MARLRATYRLQLNSQFGFDDARRVVPYLEALGVSHLYLSPSMQARPGSEHGYDVIDPTRISDDLGGPDAFEALARSGLGVILDIVPNHMAVDDLNRWWTDPDRRSRYFDIDAATGAHRRFFDVDGLGGVRQEDPEVFATTHAAAFDLLRRGLVDGLRVDHPDGLADPTGYLQQLRQQVDRIWVEKILHPGEQMRASWPVSGTTGYEYLADATALLIDPAGEEPLTDLYGTYTGERRSFAEVAQEARLEQALTTFTPEVERLKALADVPGLVAGLIAIPVYRTYIDPASGVVTPEDRALIEAADLSPELARILLLEERGHDEFVIRFQQTAPAIMAKGVEDTAFYRYHRLLAHNEVGNSPSRWSLTPTAFHAANQERLEHHPESLLAATTHDTKRSADCRFRIGALASMADEYGQLLERWTQAAGPLVAGDTPSPNEQWFIFQTLIGAWPITTDRLDGYLLKALREAKVHTSWAEPDEGHEQQVIDFARGLLDHPTFLAEFRPFVEQVALAGERASVIEAVLRCTVPGVPDIFQGDELWFLGLVDPDNRRPLDWISRRRALARVQRGGPPSRGFAKLHVLHHALDLRRRRPAPFAGGYHPLEAGASSLAFLRGDEPGQVLVVAALRPDPTAEFDAPPGLWTDVLTGRHHDLSGPTPVSAVTTSLGVALLTRP